VSNPSQHSIAADEPLAELLPVLQFQLREALAVPIPEPPSLPLLSAATSRSHGVEQVDPLLNAFLDGVFTAASPSLDELGATESLTQTQPQCSEVSVGQCSASTGRQSDRPYARRKQPTRLELIRAAQQQAAQQAADASESGSSEDEDELFFQARRRRAAPATPVISPQQTKEAQLRVTFREPLTDTHGQDFDHQEESIGTNLNCKPHFIQS
jgi:hypothetical protein